MRSPFLGTEYKVVGVYARIVLQAVIDIASIRLQGTGYVFRPPLFLDGDFFGGGGGGSFGFGCLPLWGWRPSRSGTFLPSFLAITAISPFITATILFDLVLVKINSIDTVRL